MRLLPGMVLSSRMAVNPLTNIAVFARTVMVWSNNDTPEYTLMLLHYSYIYYSLFTPSTRTRQNCLVLSCPCRRCEQVITLKRQHAIANVGQS